MQVNHEWIYYVFNIEMATACEISSLTSKCKFKNNTMKIQVHTHMKCQGAAIQVYMVLPSARSDWLNLR